MASQINLTALVGQADRDLLVTGLQALWRERVTAWNCACSVVPHGMSAPDRNDFGIAEVDDLLRRLGAAPLKF